MGEQCSAAALRCDQPRCSRMGVAACEGNTPDRHCGGRGQQERLPTGPCTHSACVRIAKDRAAPNPDPDPITL
eukprot:scaffold5922_cov45-Phaeocystis_antarctica.AAC.1